MQFLANISSFKFSPVTGTCRPAVYEKLVHGYGQAQKPLSPFAELVYPGGLGVECSLCKHLAT